MESRNIVSSRWSDSTSNFKDSILKSIPFATEYFSARKSNQKSQNTASRVDGAQFYPFKTQRFAPSPFK